MTMMIVVMIVMMTTMMVDGDLGDSVVAGHVAHLHSQTVMVMAIMILMVLNTMMIAMVITWWAPLRRGSQQANVRPGFSVSQGLHKGHEDPAGNHGDDERPN